MYSVKFIKIDYTTTYTIFIYLFWISILFQSFFVDFNSSNIFSFISLLSKTKLLNSSCPCRYFLRYSESLTNPKIFFSSICDLILYHLGFQPYFLLHNYLFYIFLLFHKTLIYINTFFVAHNKTLIQNIEMILVSGVILLSTPAESVITVNSSISNKRLYQNCTP